MPRQREGDRAGRGTVALGLLLLALGACLVVSLGVGPAGLSPARVVEILLAGPGSRESMGETVIVWQIRLPRALLGALVGASLGVSGAVMQGLFRNPLADPGLIGISSGSALGAVSMIVGAGGVLRTLAAALGGFALPVAAFVGGLAATSVLYAIATRQGRTSVATLLLAGIAIGAFASAALGLLVYLSDDQQLRDITFWTLGGLAGANWPKLFACGPIMLAALLAVLTLGRSLNALTLGEAEAFHLGIRVQRVKRLAIFLVCAATGAAVAVAGVVGFVGIVVPHMLRLAIGADHRVLLPGSALLGAILLLLADMVARTVASPAELPIGILTAALGAPFFLWLLLRRRGLAAF
ncbi:MULTISPECIES: FecCD family ABC transporter permease [unclassified Aureimonas]|uniref:FecCD family ABC transporter permease n=1 Tax=unclassified Aureimonas TaxID=2615206 RepID=UPI001FCE2922|nr:MULTISPECIES: iron ABC transporter permease [unclassified Aureimonas]